jgi:hypothetical protein
MAAVTREAGFIIDAGPNKKGAPERALPIGYRPQLRDLQGMTAV